MKDNLSRFVTLLGILSSAVALSPITKNGVVLRQKRWTVGQTVETSSGSVQGHASSNFTEVSEYLGIPYAQPPLGKLRFQPPVKYSGTKLIVGDAFGPSCMATNISDTDTSNPDVFSNITVTPVALDLLDSLGNMTHQSEDCLTVNVWTKPQVGEVKKAVMVWIHGGAYTAGGSSIPWFNGQFLVEKEDVIVVSLNYRLSIFGFPGNPTSRPNIGFLDQRLAIEWVQDNIEAFGGDASRITLFGQSAGGASVDYYSYIWTDDPIAHAFIPMSGTAAGFGQLSNETASSFWFNATEAVGCGGASDDADKVFECMMSKDAAEIAAKIPANAVADSDNGLPFGPAVDETLVFSNYTGRKSIAAPVLVGNTDFEAGLFRLLAPEVPEEAWPFVNARAFVCPAAVRAAESVLQGNPTWRYRWFGDFPNLELTTNPPSGAWHSSEVPVLFNTTMTDILPDSPEEQAIAIYLRGAWATFAKDPVNGLSTYGGGWPRYSTKKSTLIRLAYENKVGVNAGIGDEYDDECTGVPVVTSPTNGSSPSTSSGAPVPTNTDSSGNQAGPMINLLVGVLVVVGFFL